MSATKLPPCPVCNRKPHGPYGPSAANGRWSVMCFGNACQTHMLEVTARSEKQAIRAWRLIADKDDLPGELRLLVAADDSVAVMDRLKAYLGLPPYGRRLAAARERKP